MLVLDATDGAIKESFDFSSVATSLFHVEDETVYWQQWATCLLASDSQTGETIWELSFEGGFEQTPIFVRDNVYVISFGGQLFAIDKKSGELLWKTKQLESLTDPNRVVSNVAVDDGIIYALTQDAQLNAIDAASGKLIAQVEFTPNLYELENAPRSYRFDVTADDGIVAVYFGDSSQVFTFEFQPEE